MGDLDVFRAEHWGRRPLWRHTDLCFRSLLDVPTVEALIDASARRPELRLVRDGTTLPPGDYTRSVHLGGTEVPGVADPGRIAAAVADGATLVLQGLQHTWPPLGRLARSLEQAISHPVQVNAYLSPPGTPGLAAHTDTHDVIVLQVRGAKSWEIDGLGATPLRAGDVLYLPAGTRHAALAEPGGSLHITIGILRITRADLLRRMLRSIEGLDAPLPLGFAADGHVAFETELRSVVAALGASLAAVDVGALAAAERARAIERLRPIADGRLDSLLALDHLADTTRVRPRTDC